MITLGTEWLRQKSKGRGGIVLGRNCSIPAVWEAAKKCKILRPTVSICLITTQVRFSIRQSRECYKTYWIKKKAHHIASIELRLRV